MDLFRQAEHDELAQSILLCPDAAYIDAVQREIDRLLPQMPRAAIIAKSLSDRGALIHTRSMEEACAIQPHRTRAPGGVQPRAAPLGNPCCATPVPSSWAPSRRKAWATTAPAPTTCCPPAARALLQPAGRVRCDFQKRSSLIEVSEQRRPIAGQNSQRAGPLRRRIAGPCTGLQRCV